MRKLLLLATLALAALPAAALAADPPSAADQANAAKACAAQRTAMGVDFKALYGTNPDKSNAYGKCVSKLARAEQGNRANAAKACTAEQADAGFAAAHGSKTFDQLYGSGKSGKNAFGQCVAQKAKAASQAQQQATINAAKACKAERKPDPAGFKTKYGTNLNKSNAFGKCVAAKASGK